MKRKEQLKKYRKMTLRELARAEQKIRQKIFDLKMKLPLGKVKNTAQLKELKKELARIMTIMREKAKEELEKEQKKKKN